MDFDLDEAQRVIAESAADVLRRADSEPAAAWRGLASAGLLALTLPGWLGGDGLGVLEAAVLLTEVGRAAAAVPALATVALGALPVVRWGSRELQERVLAGVGGGQTIVTAGVREASTGFARAPATILRPAGDMIGGTADGATVTGTKIGVPYADQARWLLVPVTVAGGGLAGGGAVSDRVVAVVDRSAAGVTMHRTPASGDSPEYTVRLDAAPVAGVLGSGPAAGARPDGGDPVADLYLLAAAGAAAIADGAVAGALALTASYVAGREQFGRKLATFQAVAGQAADVYIASRTLHLAALSACWRLAAGRDAAEDAEVAAWWLAQEAPAALRTCHQLHGGIGVDIGYPLHRYSAMVSDLARFVGGAGYRLDVLAAGTVPCSST